MNPGDYLNLDYFHPATRNWFEKHFSAPTEPQSRAWPAIKEGRHVLIAAPTGSGKTLSAFLSAIDDLVRQGLDTGLEDVTQVVYVSPLKALSNDIQKNLQEPLEGIREELKKLGLPDIGIRTLVRTGDTSSADRARMIKRPPHIAVTTPESLYILLTSEGGRRMLRNARTVIVDEIHALANNKRGSHLALSMERLDELTGGKLVRIGLSATQQPIEEVARFLIGTNFIDEGGTPDCTIIDTGHRRNLDLAIEVPGSPLEAVISGEVWEEIYERVSTLIVQHKTTLIFVNTRRMAERVARHLGERVGDENVTSHHGSLSRERRLQAEQRLKSGDLRALVATASLELGIDIGSVDLVCQLGSTRSISALLQRVGRSGHWIGGSPKGRVFPTTRDELIECAALFDSVRRGELDRLCIPEKPLDVLAQQLTAAVACDEWTEDNLFNLIRGAYPYRHLTREEFDSIVKMLAEGFTTRRGRHGALIHYDGINHRLRERRGSRLIAITNGGAIPDNADYDVILEPGETFIGTVNEDFAVESLQGDIFQLGNASWRITRVERGKVRVEDAHGQPPTMPFWLGEANSRTKELSASVSRLRSEAASLIGTEAAPDSIYGSAALAWLVEDVGIAQAAAEQIVEYLAMTRVALGVMPSQQTIVFERFFDETGGTQLVIHSPFGSRLNRAWGLALRKRFCRKFNFELQAAATEDSIVLSFGATHSFPIEDVFGYLRSTSVREVLIQALLAAPMFTTRWRWVANRALAVLRRRGGKKIPAQFQRIDAEDLLAVVFPDQLACAENISGNREIPDHPLVNQAIRDCLEEAMDIDSLEALLASIERGEIELLAREMTEPSPLAQEILNARPYAYLDDAPLEERRTQAVMSRRWSGVDSASDLGTLDQSAIDRVRDEAWPLVENADELHDALMQLGFITEEEGRLGAALVTPDETGGGWQGCLDQLVVDRRALVIEGGNHRPLWIAAEREPQIKRAFDGSSEDLREVLRGRLEGIGPTTLEAIAASAGLATGDVDIALAALEAEGFVMRGRFTPGVDTLEWCVRRLLARIHGYTLNRLRKEVEPVSSADFMRFLFDWQRASEENHADGQEGLAAVLEQLEGFEAPAAAWEGEILPGRMPDYDPTWLDALCLSGRIIWSRLTPPKPGPERGRAGPIKTTPITLLQRKNAANWNKSFPIATRDEIKLSALAEPVLDHLGKHGASFFNDLVEGSRLLPAQVEDALGELVAFGLVTADSFTGLRALLTPSNKRLSSSSGRKKSHAPFGMEHAGRWSLLRKETFEATRGPVSGNAKSPSYPGYDPESIETIARTLLKRWGVIFRKLLDREGLSLPWRELIRVYRRLEARGEIRGGRFVGGHSGEQYALPEAVGMLRSIRRSAPSGLLVSVSAADPLNLVGLITPGDRVTSASANRVLYRDGEAIAILESKEIRFLTQLESASEWKARNALVQRHIPPELRAYLGYSA